MLKQMILLGPLGLAACEPGAATTGAGTPCQEALVADIPFTLEGGHLRVNAGINGQPVSFYFATSAFTTTLTHDAAMRLHLRNQGQFGESVGIGGDTSRLDTVVADTFSLGRIHGTDLMFLADRDPEPQPPPVDGELSNDMLADYDIDLDFPEQHIILYDPQGACKASPTAVLGGELYAVPLVAPELTERSFDPGGIQTKLHAGEPEDLTDRVQTPLVNVSIDGRVLKASINTGQSRTVMFRSAMTLAEAAAAAPDPGTARTIGMGRHAVTQLETISPPIGIGELTIRNLPITLIDKARFGAADVMLGNDFLSRVHVWISHASGMLVMQVPPEPSPPRTAIP